MTMCSLIDYIYKSDSNSSRYSIKEMKWNYVKLMSRNSAVASQNLSFQEFSFGGSIFLLDLLRYIYVYAYIQNTLD